MGRLEWQNTPEHRPWLPLLWKSGVLSRRAQRKGILSARFRSGFWAELHERSNRWSSGPFQSGLVRPKRTIGAPTESSFYGRARKHPLIRQHGTLYCPDRSPERLRQFTKTALFPRISLRGWDGKYLGFRINCEQVPIPPAGIRRSQTQTMRSDGADGDRTQQRLRAKTTARIIFLQGWLGVTGSFRAFRDRPTFRGRFRSLEVSLPTVDGAVAFFADPNGEARSTRDE